MKLVYIIYLAIALPLTLLLTNAAADQTSSPPLNSASETIQTWLKQSTDEAQRRCHEYMHDDATEYKSCLNSLLAAIKGKDSKAQQQRLGISYFAWVGANNSARLSLPGAEAAAQFYLPKFRQLQNQLKITDEYLCQSIAGDCKARVAQYLKMEIELQEMKTQAKVLTKAKQNTSSK